MSQQTTAHSLQLSRMARAVVRVLLYYDIWEYPLTAVEAHRMMQEQICTVEEVERELESLRNAGLVHQLGQYWAVSPLEGQPAKRQRGNLLCQERMRTARRYSRLIASFPWVRAVCLSGSISKGYMDEEADIDYFIITAPGRLWLARTLLILFKKTVLLNSRRNFCVNYFVDTDHLAIQDHNLFTATEAATLVPVVGGEWYQRFVEANPWLGATFPNWQPREVKDCLPGRRRGLKWMQEVFTPGFVARGLDTWCMNRTRRRWKSKFSHFGEEKLKNALASEKNVSKHHPQDYRSKVIRRMAEQCAAFEQRFNTSLGHD